MCRGAEMFRLGGAERDRTNDLLSAMAFQLVSSGDASFN